MKIVFIQPNVGFKGHTWEALGIGYLVSYLKKHFPDKLEFDFFSGFYDSDTDILKGCEDADIVGFSCTSPQYKHGLDLAKQIKTSSNCIVFGGIHPTVIGPVGFFNLDFIDKVIEGEGESQFLTRVEEFARNENYVLISREQIEDLDSLPFPDRKVIKQERNIQQAFKDEGRRVASILSSRGCPFSCRFCSSHALWGRKVRFRSATNILDEMEELVNVWGIEFVKFADDTFTLSRNLTRKFCNEKIARDITIPYGANAHVETVDLPVIEELAYSGCEEVWFGVESGSPRILNLIHKNLDPKRVIEVFAMCKDYGIKTRAYFLLGIPGETLEDIAYTENLCDEIKPDKVGFTLLSPFPGNEYYNPEVMSDWDWSQFNEYDNPWIDQKYKDAQRRLVEKYRDRAVFRQKQPAS